MTLTKMREHANLGTAVKVTLCLVVIGAFAATETLLATAHAASSSPAASSPQAGSPPGGAPPDAGGPGEMMQTDASKMTPAQKQMVQVRQDEQDIQSMITGIVALERNRKYAITAAEAKKLLPVATKILDKDILGVKATNKAPHGQQGGSASGPSATMTAKMAADMAARAKVMADTLTAMENCLTPAQLGAIDSLTLGQSAASKSSATTRRPSGGGPGGGMMGMGSSTLGIVANKGNSTGQTTMTDADRAKMQAQMQKARDEQQKKQLAALTDLLALLKKKAK